VVLAARCALRAWCVPFECLCTCSRTELRGRCIYQHASRERELEITEALSSRIEAVRAGDLPREWHEADSDEDVEGA
jgi:hypothetical protein